MEIGLGLGGTNKRKEMQVLGGTNTVMGETAIENQGDSVCRGKHADDWDLKQNFTFRVCFSRRFGVAHGG